MQRFYIIYHYKNTEVPLIGCGNHKLHLDVLEAMGKEIRRNRRGTVTQVADGFQPSIRKNDLLMGELTTLKNASLLRYKTDKYPTRKCYSLGKYIENVAKIDGIA
jgi:hypothetical protein